MTGLMAFRGRGSISSRMARVEQLPIFPFISSAYSISSDMETKRQDLAKWRSIV